MNVFVREEKAAILTADTLILIGKAGEVVQSLQF